MAARIVINPSTFRNKKDAMCVAFNERFRIAMEQYGFEPQSEPTDRQRRFFSDTAYADDEVQLRRTILARILTLDTSVKDPTDEQLQEAVAFLQEFKRRERPSNDWEASAIDRLEVLVQTVVNKGKRAVPKPHDGKGGGRAAQAGIGAGITKDEEEEAEAERGDSDNDGSGLKDTPETEGTGDAYLGGKDGRGQSYIPEFTGELNPNGETAPITADVTGASGPAIPVDGEPPKARVEAQAKEDREVEVPKPVTREVSQEVAADNDVRMTLADPTLNPGDAAPTVVPEKEPGSKESRNQESDDPSLTKGQIADPAVFNGNNPEKPVQPDEFDNTDVQSKAIVTNNGLVMSESEAQRQADTFRQWLMGPNNRNSSAEALVGDTVPSPLAPKPDQQPQNEGHVLDSETQPGLPATQPEAGETPETQEAQERAQEVQGQSEVPAQIEDTPRTTKSQRRMRRYLRALYGKEYAYGAVYGPGSQPRATPRRNS